MGGPSGSEEVASSDLHRKFVVLRMHLFSRGVNREYRLLSSSKHTLCSRKAGIPMTSSGGLDMESLTRQILVVDATITKLLSPRWNTLDGRKPAVIDRHEAAAKISTPFELATRHTLADHRTEPTEAFLLPGGTLGADTTRERTPPLEPGKRYLLVFIPTLLAGTAGNTQRLLQVYIACPIDAQDRLVLMTPLLDLAPLIVSEPMWQAGQTLPMARLLDYLATHPGGIDPVDTSLTGQLALSLKLKIGGYDASTRDMTELNVTLTHQGRRVRLRAGEQISCNGIALAGYESNFHLKVPSEVYSGKLVTCTYTSGKTSATFTFTAPLAPIILSPQENAQVARSTHTPVRYRISPDWAFYVIALDPPKKAWTPEAAAQPNPVLLDTSAFPAGPGSIAIHQLFTLPDLHGPDFQSVQGQGGAHYRMEVTWV